MKRSRFTEAQIVAILKQVEGGRTVKEVCREYGIAEGTYITTGRPSMAVWRRLTSSG